MSTQQLQTQTVKPTAREMEFIPYGTADKIKLTIEIVKNIIAVPTRSGKTCSDKDAIKFMMMCQAKRLNPFEGDAFLVGYDGQSGPEFSLITAHQAFLKRAELHPEYDGMKSGIIIRKEDGTTVDVEGDFHFESDEVVGGWATVFFKNRKYPCTRRIRIERFNKGFAQWKVDPAGMICKCAEADALRSSFPTMLGGLYMREEIDASNFGMQVSIDQVRSKPNLELVVGQPDPVAQERAIEAPKETPPPEPVPQNKRQPVQRHPTPAATAQEAINAAIGKPASTPMTPAREPEPEPESNPAAPTSSPLHATMQQFLDNGHIPFDDFQDFLVADGHYKDAKSCSVMDEIPSKVLADLNKNTAAMGKLFKMFGRP